MVEGKAARGYQRSLIKLGDTNVYSPTSTIKAKVRWWHTIYFSKELVDRQEIISAK